jgi:glutaredoxin
MNRTRGLSFLFLLACTAGAHAQLYKSVGPDGKVTYSDTPPASAKRVETKSIASGSAGGVNLPYELAESVKNNPVTLYTSDKCAPCDDGRKLLTARGIPFAEKTISSNEDIARLKQAGGNTQLPLLLVGRNKQQGFEPGGWGSALTAAGYPETSKLPGNYRNPQAEAAAPAPKPLAAKQAGNEQAATRTADDSLPATGNAPPGFRF